MHFKILRVVGNSMHPTLESGAFVLVWQSPYLYKPKKHHEQKKYHKQKKYQRKKWHILFRNGLNIGDMVAVQHPKYGQIIKRIRCLRYDKGIGSMRLAGDNEIQSVSEEGMGWVAIENVIGVVVLAVNKAQKKP